MVATDFIEDEFNFGTYGSTSQIFKIKTCTCSIGRETCPFHSATDRSSGDGYCRLNSDLKISDISLSSHSNSFATESSVTIIPKPKTESKFFEELKLSLTSLNTDNDEETTDKEVAFQRWLAEKERQRKEDLKKKEHIKKYLVNEKEKKLELERQNFAAWLKSKKERERAEQMIQQQKENEEKKLLEEKEKKKKLAQIKMKLWLKQKEEKLLLNKMQEQLCKIKNEEEKQKRMQDSMAAYENWLKKSKTKPKPVPLNQGLDSLRTSVSVSYINPSPWIPNIDKPLTK